MNYPRLIAVITALTLFQGTHVARADYSLSQLQLIEGLISSGNWQALYDFLSANPAILIGNDALVQELKSFMQSFEEHKLTDFASIFTKDDDVRPVELPLPEPIY